jgi:hypothetical protein
VIPHGSPSVNKRNTVFRTGGTDGEPRIAQCDECARVVKMRHAATVADIVQHCAAQLADDTVPRRVLIRRFVAAPGRQHKAHAAGELQPERPGARRPRAHSVESLTLLVPVRRGAGTREQSGLMTARAVLATVVGGACR